VFQLHDGPKWPRIAAAHTAVPVGLGLADEALVRLGFTSLLDSQPDLTVVGVAADGREAVRLAGQLAPDIVLMDIRMPVLGGIDATRLLQDNPDPPKVLILTTFDLDDYVYDALRAGASGFLLKDATPEQILEAVRVLGAGDALLAPAVTRRLIAEFAGRARFVGDQRSPT
jgi:DNA-binding NarL/FixJ family response regulator